jgi:hypothetical protein
MENLGCMMNSENMLAMPDCSWDWSVNSEAKLDYKSVRREINVIKEAL